MKVIGKVKDAHGLRGELKILIFSKDFSWVDALQEFELQSPQGKKLTCTVKEIRETPEYLIVACEEVRDRTQAESLRGWEFAVDDELFVSKPGETIFLNEILHFNVYDTEGKELGQITGFGSNGFQDLLQVSVNGLVFEIPFVSEFIVEIAFEKKSVTLDLPPGLFDPELVGPKKS